MLPLRQRIPARNDASRWSRLVIILVLLLTGTLAWSETATTKEYQVKAAFLLRFLQFVEWPERSFTTPEAPIRIGILGDDPFGQALDQITAVERIRNRPVVVERAAAARDLHQCHMIFVAGSERERLDLVAMQLPAEGVLTISDIDGFAERGGMIRFFLADKKVRFEINPSVAQRQQLKISAQLLSLGRIVGQSGPAGVP